MDLYGFSLDSCRYTVIVAAVKQTTNTQGHTMQTLQDKIKLAGIIAEVKRINRKAKIEKLVQKDGLTYRQAMDIVNQNK